MGTNLQVFDFESHTIRTIIGSDGEPWWVAADVCRVLSIVNVGDAIAKLDDDERRDDIGITDVIGRQQKTWMVNEPGLYTLVFRSNKPEAKRFRKWVTSEVLPAIRKTGRYAAGDQEGDYLLREIDAIRQLRLDQIEADRRLAVAERELRECQTLAAGANAKAEQAIATLIDDTKYMSLVGWNARHKLGLTRQEIAVEGGKITRACRKAGIPLKEVPSEVWGKINAYPTDVLQRWMDSRSTGLAAAN